jgi:ATP-dependent phosphofructokinase / diphosphate-dependent phosphofructokinase
MAKNKTQCIGILTSGGDCPGLNAAIRGVVKAAYGQYGIKCIGILDGFRGLVENRTMVLDDRATSNILTDGGTILGTSRDKPHKMPMGGKILDMTRTAVENAKRLQIDCLVCLGGAGTQKNALRLHEAGLNVLTLPKTIDNDVAETDITFGFDTALGIATEAIDRLHTTATSHQRAIVVEIMGHNAGWLALGAGIAGGADVVLLPEIPYDPEMVARHLNERSRAGKRFSIIAVAEGAHSHEEVKALAALEKKALQAKQAKQMAKRAKQGELKAADLRDPDRAEAPIKTVTIKRGETAVEMTYHSVQEPKASRLARHLQELTGMEARVTTLGHVQRGGGPSAADRLLCTRLGTTAAQLLAEGRYNVMVGVKGDRCEAVPLKLVAGRIKIVPQDHAWITTGRLVGTCFGD